MADNLTIAEATNFEGKTMTLGFAPTRSWQAFIITGMPNPGKSNEGKGMSLGKAVDVWNASIQSRRDALKTITVSARLRVIADQAREARTAESRTRALPNF